MNKDIIILDDTNEFQTQHRDRLLQNVPEVEAKFNVPIVPIEDFENGLRVLLKRAGKSIDIEDAETCFDRAAILFVDYRLLDLRLEGFFTGEQVAYLARSFSRCGLIVALNQFGEKTFDLTLCGHPESYADLNIGASDLENAGLWRNDWAGFRPWHWPLLPSALEAFERRANNLDLKASILDSLGFSAGHVRSFPRAVLEFITRHKTSDDARKTTFEEFVKESGNGLQRKDRTSEEMLQRIAAARIGKWLERLVLGGQNTLVDAPHLVGRYPSVLNGDWTKESLNLTTRIDRADGLPLRHSLLNRHIFPYADWLSRPAWFWETLKDEPEIEEVKDPWNRKEATLRFCEDSSQFHPLTETSEFVASVASPFTRRFVKRFRDVDYVPELRFAM